MQDESALCRRGARGVTTISRRASRRRSRRASSRRASPPIPGIGFGKTLAHNLALLAHITLFHGLGVPLLIGASRKRFIKGVSGGEKAASSREPGSQAAAIAAASARGTNFAGA